jgi:N-methylhydantoinase B/oxoprolinase/acetone carboxylase alpha subunit
MKPNRLTFSFLCLFFILMLQGCGQEKVKTSNAGATNNPPSIVKSGFDYDVEGASGKKIRLHFDSRPNEDEIDKAFRNACMPSAEQGDAKAQFEVGKSCFEVA